MRCDSLALTHESRKLHELWEQYAQYYRENCLTDDQLMILLGMWEAHPDKHQLMPRILVPVMMLMELGADSASSFLHRFEWRKHAV